MAREGEEGEGEKGEGEEGEGEEGGRWDLWRCVRRESVRGRRGREGRRRESLRGVCVLGDLAGLEDVERS